MNCHTREQRASIYSPNSLYVKVSYVSKRHLDQLESVRAVFRGFLCGLPVGLHLDSKSGRYSHVASHGIPAALHLDSKSGRYFHVASRGLPAGLHLESKSGRYSHVASRGLPWPPSGITSWGQSRPVFLFLVLCFVFFVLFILSVLFVSFFVLFCCFLPG